MRTNWQTYPIVFTGGLISNMDRIQQGSQFPGSATELVNFEPSVEGGYRKVLGYQKWCDFPVPTVSGNSVNAVFLMNPSKVVAVKGTNYYLSESKADWVLSTTVPIAPAKVRHQIYNFNGDEKSVFVDGVNKPLHFDILTNTFSLDSAAPSDVEGASFVAEFAKRLFFAKGSMLVYTNLLEGTNFDTALGSGVIDVTDDITGLIVFRQQLIIFSADRIQRLTGTSEQDFQLSDITRKTGCSWPESIQEVGGDILYKGPDGIRFLSATERIGDFALSRASEAIQDKITDVYSGVDNVCSTVIRSKSQYRLFRFEPSLSPGSQIGYICTRFEDQSSANNSWAETRGFKIKSVDSKQFNEEEIIIFTDGGDNVYQMEFGYSFDGEPISCAFETPFLTLDDPRVRKTYYKHQLFLKLNGPFYIEGSLTLDYGNKAAIQPPKFFIGDNETSDAYYGVAIYGQSTYSSGVRSEYVNNVVGSGFSVSLSYKDTSVNPSFLITSATLEYRLNDRK